MCQDVSRQPVTPFIVERLRGFVSCARWFIKSIGHNSESEKMLFKSRNINAKRPLVDLPLQPSAELSAEKSAKADEEDGAKPKFIETKKVTKLLILFKMID